jgi:hypothetical protein
MSRLQNSLNAVNIPSNLTTPEGNGFWPAATVLVSREDFPLTPPREITEVKLSSLHKRALAFNLSELATTLFRAFDEKTIGADPWAIVALGNLLAVRRFGEVQKIDIPKIEKDFGEIALQKAATTIATGRNSRWAATLQGKHTEKLPLGILQRPGGVVVGVSALATSRFTPDDDERISQELATVLDIATGKTYASYPGDIGVFRTNGILPPIGVISGKKTHYYRLTSFTYRSSP